VEEELNDLARYLFLDSGSHHKLREWLVETDGDFIVFILEKRSGDAVFFNDVLGRLPTYIKFAVGDDQVILSREIRFIGSLAPRRKFDTLGMAEYLLLGHSLASRTLLDSVRHVSPASLVRVSRRAVRVTVSNFDFLNLDVRRNTSKKIKENAAVLASLFQEACVNRSDPKKQNVLALSGGLDSRAVAAALTAKHIPFSAATHLRSEIRFATDANIARELADMLNVSWRVFNLRPLCGRELWMLLRMKSGLNSLEMTFMLPFLTSIQNVHGSDVTYWTGDGGNKLQRSLLPDRKLNSISDLVKYVVRMHQVLPVNKVAALTRVSVADILDRIRETLSTYPESDYSQKYVRFYLAEKTVRWNFEGEDRNRFYFWSVTPFFSNRFFSYLLDCGEDQKIKHRLYTEFLSILEPRALRVANSNWGYPVTSERYFVMKAFRKLFLDRFSPAFRRSIRRSCRPIDNAQYKSLLEIQSRRCDSIKEYLAVDVLQSWRTLEKIQLQRILSITSTIEYLESGRSILEDHFETTFA
jgi:asparagine synthase (glutamine-hydrolysing)